MSDEQVLAIDLGGTKVEVAIVSDATIVKRSKFPTAPQRGYTYCLENIINAARHLMAETTVSSIALCSPGPVDHISGTLLNPANLGWGSVTIGSDLSDALSLPCVVDHDGKVAALGEYMFGLNKKIGTFVYIVIGTGVGAAIMYNHRLFRGETNAAGEIGHMTINYDGASLSLDNQATTRIPGEVESLISGPWITHRYIRELRQHNINPSTRRCDVQSIGAAAQSDDVHAQTAITSAAQALGVTISCMAMTLDITYFILGSSVAKLGNLLIEPALEAARQYSVPSVAERISIQPCRVMNDASLLGCYYLATHNTHTVDGDID